MIQLLTNILVFLWEVFMEKSKPGQTIASKTDRLKKFFVFVAASLSIVLNVLLMERLITISANHVALTKAYTVCGSKIASCDTTTALLTASQNNLEMCLLKGR